MNIEDAVRQALREIAAWGRDVENKNYAMLQTPKRQRLVREAARKIAYEARGRLDGFVIFEDNDGYKLSVLFQNAGMGLIDFNFYLVNTKRNEAIGWTSNIDYVIGWIKKYSSIERAAAFASPTVRALIARYGARASGAGLFGLGKVTRRRR
jgi:hypothetical protein